jgi:hypothetical protein
MRSERFRPIIKERTVSTTDQVFNAALHTSQDIIEAFDNVYDVVDIIEAFDNVYDVVENTARGTVLMGEASN